MVITYFFDATTKYENRTILTTRPRQAVHAVHDYHVIRVVHDYHVLFMVIMLFMLVMDWRVFASRSCRNDSA